MIDYDWETGKVQQEVSVVGVRFQNGKEYTAEELMEIAKNLKEAEGKPLLALRNTYADSDYANEERELVFDRLFIRLDADLDQYEDYAYLHCSVIGERAITESEYAGHAEDLRIREEAKKREKREQYERLKEEFEG